MSLIQGKSEIQLKFSCALIRKMCSEGYTLYVSYIAPPSLPILLLFPQITQTKTCLCLIIKVAQQFMVDFPNIILFSLQNCLLY